MRGKVRFAQIDLLRAIAIVGIVVVHLLERHLGSPINYFFWNFFQFVVVSLVFCSGYVNMATAPAFTNMSATLRWYRKRFVRLLAPYWGYFALHYGLWLVFPAFLTGRDFARSWEFIVGSVTMVGGVDVGWIALLFIVLALLTPKFALALAKKKQSFWLYVIGAFLFTIWLTVQPFPVEFYRLVMWVPWSLVFLAGMIFYLRERRERSETRNFRRYLIWGVQSFVFFLIYFFLWQLLGRSTRLIDNKYPPNFYHLTYGFAITCFLLAGEKYVIPKLKPVWPAVLFLSKHAYSLFFLHYIVIDFVRTAGIV